MRRSAALLCALMLLSAAALAGCGKGEGEKPRIVLTTGFADDEVFRVEDMSCTSSEVMVYLVNLHDQYESAFGSGIWDTKVGDSTLEESIRQTVLARLAKIKMMNLLAAKYDISLTREEEELAEAAAEEYFSGLTLPEIGAIGGIRKEDVARMYKEYALSEKVYEQLTADVNTEVSDDEARIIAVEQIGLLTYTEDGEGVRTEKDTASKQRALEKAERIKKRLDEGEEFSTLCVLYNEAPSDSAGIAAGQGSEAAAQACTNLAEGEISDIVETEDGYFIYRCVNTFDREQTTGRKDEIVRERKKAAFTAIYEAFAAEHSIYRNDGLWGSIGFEGSVDVHTANFFDVYEKYFVSTR